VISEAPIRHYETIDSTNLEAHRLFQAGEYGPLWLLADEQTAGKGRLDRRWASAQGNCYSTLILPLSRHSGESKNLFKSNDDQIPAFAGMTEMGLASIPQIGFVVALAVADVVSAVTTPTLKWPNDVLVNGAKISGILCEVLSPSPLTTAIGCGINVAHAPEGLAYPAACFAALGHTTTRDEVFASYKQTLAHRVQQWSQGFATIRDDWLRLAIGIGETVTMTTGNNQLTGTFETITEQGAIVLKPQDGPSRILNAGDLHIPSLAKLRNGHQ
jgi:BirA family transcriptional regulator, biotin operon repressor / biotin---[acetyl-CoA-carboxylase] ligase